MLNYQQRNAIGLPRGSLPNQPTPSFRPFTAGVADNNRLGVSKGLEASHQNSKQTSLNKSQERFFSRLSMKPFKIIITDKDTDRQDKKRGSCQSETKLPDGEGKNNDIFITKVQTLADYFKEKDNVQLLKQEEDSYQKEEGAAETADENVNIDQDLRKARTQLSSRMDDMRQLKQMVTDTKERITQNRRQLSTAQQTAHPYVQSSLPHQRKGLRTPNSLDYGIRFRKQQNIVLNDFVRESAFPAEQNSGIHQQTLNDYNFKPRQLATNQQRPISNNNKLLFVKKAPNPAPVHGQIRGNQGPQNHNSLNLKLKFQYQRFAKKQQHSYQQKSTFNIQQNPYQNSIKRNQTAAVAAGQRNLQRGQTKLQFSFQNSDRRGPYPKALVSMSSSLSINNASTFQQGWMRNTKRISSGYRQQAI